MKNIRSTKGVHPVPKASNNKDIFSPSRAPSSLLVTFSCKMVAKKKRMNGSTLHVVSPPFVCLIIWPICFQICWLPIGDFCQNFSHLMYFSLAMVIKVVVTWSTDILSWLLALTTQLPMSRFKFFIIRVSLFTELRMYSWLYIIFSCFYSSYKNSNWLTCFISLLFALVKSYRTTSP